MKVSGGYTMGIRWVYEGIRWYGWVYDGYTEYLVGIRWVYGGYTVYMVGIRWVYDGYTVGYVLGIRWVYDRYTPVYGYDRYHIYTTVITVKYYNDSLFTTVMTAKKTSIFFSSS